MSKVFLDRYASVFGRPSAMMLRIAGLTASEYTGQGAIITDETGREWLDFGSFGLHLLGHRHPHIVAAAQAQLGQMGLSTKILANAPSLAAAERLAELALPGTPAGVMFGNSGSEAVEIAVKMARMATGRQGFLALNGGYHGRTDGALCLSSNYASHAGSPAVHKTVFITAGDIVAAEEALATRTIAAAFIEPIQGEGGIHPMPEGFLTALREVCTRHGTLLISDEIQTGLGRGGTLVTCSDADILLFGKILAGGIIPVSAAVFRSDVIGSKARDPIASASSYAGGPLAGAVVGAVLDVVTASNFLPKLQAKGDAFLTHLRQAIGSSPGVSAIRGAGMMFGIELTNPQMAGEVLLEAASRRLLLSFCLSAPSVLRCYPPAVATESEMTTALEVLRISIEIAWQRIHDSNQGGRPVAPSLTH
ncbi:MAG: aminotransferase class III-fold pyridoxal phosphate-dependent enzyme [Rhodobacteraceae bacterium]|nr:aminotransferase class III-fold pyridoxal phosphate-dependent enzyme [Paracoccaceae bacterium]